MNIDCTKWRELASDFIEGTLPADMQKAVTVHLRGCANCRQDEAALRAISRELNGLPEVDPPLFFRDNVMSRIEREGRVPTGAWWQSLWSGYGRLVVGTSLGVSVFAAIGLALILPKANHPQQNAGISAPSFVSTTATPATTNRLPQLDLSKVVTIIPGEGPAWDFSFHLDNADAGTAKFKLGDADRQYRFQLSGTAPQTLRVPATVLSDKKVLELQVTWTGDQTSHTRYLFLPVPVEGEPAPEVHQSFGLPEYSVPDLARELTLRYRQPIILDDIPTNTTVRLTAREETAEETMRRHLSDLGLTVTSMNDGIHVQKAQEAPADKP